MEEKKGNYMYGPGSGMALMLVVFLLILALSSLWYVAFAAGAARLANQRHNSLIIAALAFMLSPFYYIYYAFTG